MALMVLTWTVWALFPGAALALFIVMSVAHFGEGDVATSDWARSDSGVAARGRFWKLRGGFLEMFARGGAFLVAVEAFPMEVRHIFIDMAGEHEVATVMGLLHNLSTCHAWATAVVGLAHLAHIHEDHSMLVAIELAVVNTLYRWCPPLVAFAIYFNFFHSLRHIMRVAEFAPETVAKRGKAVAALFTLLATLPMVAVALWNAEEFGAVGVAWIENSIKMIFIGLSVLTTPHMVLVGALHVREVTQRRAQKQKSDEDVDAAERPAAEPATAWPRPLPPVGVLPSGPPSPRRLAVAASHSVAVEVV